MNILGFIRDTNVSEMNAVTYYRTYLPLREVNHSAEGITANVIDQKRLEEVSDDELGDRDIYTMCRMYHENCEGFIAEIHRRGGVLVLDSDDDLTEDYRLVSGRGSEFKKVLGLVDYVTVSTPALAEHFSQYTFRPPTVLRNHIDTDWLIETSSKAKRLITGLTIGFSGSPTHWGDWYLPAVPLSRIVHDFDVQPVLHGDPPRYLLYLPKETIKLGQVPYAVYPVLLKQFDIVLCAVDSTDRFNSGKSAVKALETMAVGGVAICSRFEPYIELVDAGAPIVLVAEDSRDGWYEAMRQVVTEEYGRKTLAESGPGWVRENRDMCQTGYKHWEQFYREITD